MKVNKRGYFRYGVSSVERYENFFKSLMHGGNIVVAKDTEFLALNYEDGDTLPVWSSEDEAKAALPEEDWPIFEYIVFTPSEFFEKFVPPYDGMYVTIRPNQRGEAKTISLQEFREALSL